MYQVEWQVATEAVEAAPVALAVIDAHLAVQYANPKWYELTPSTSGAAWLSIVAQDDRSRLEEELASAVAAGDTWHGSWMIDSESGRVLHGALGPVPGSEGRLSAFSIVDPAEWAHSPIEVAGRDSLTGLPTREPFLRALDKACRAGGGSSLAVLFIDLDSLKPVNDQHGHLTGDRVLASIGRALESAIRSDDVAARFGGDEFVVLCRDITTADTSRLAERVHRAVADATAEIHRLTASIGIATGLPPVDALTVLDAADQAMYRAKRQGPGRSESIVVVAEPPPAARIA